MLVNGIDRLITQNGDDFVALNEIDIGGLETP